MARYFRLTSRTGTYYSVRKERQIRLYDPQSKIEIIEASQVALPHYSAQGAVLYMENVIGVLPHLCERISKAAALAPHSLALRLGAVSMSYGELYKRALQFSGYLAEQGVSRGDTVALCMERSFDWIAAALGAMQAGAAYVPFDPQWADERLRFALNDSQAKVLFARAELIDRLRLSIACLDPKRDEATLERAGRPPRTPSGDEIPPETLAYVIYTSGSTGVPKGVEITHGNLAHLIDWHCDAFQVTSKDRVTHLAGLGFDAAVWELWPALSVGAMIYLADDSVRSSPELLQQWLVREEITISFVPTALCAPMIDTQWPASTRLRILLTGGDTLHRGPVTGLPFRVVNNYGPTECTVVATSGVVAPESVGAPTIGRAISGAAIYLLDDEGREVPNGAQGEVYIGGGGVGRGYRGLPEATRLAFLTDPFSSAPDARMYRSGDRGVRTESGEIEFRGRLDRQVKIRGQRIELDEISSTLGCHPDIDFATAMVDSEPGQERLVAHVLPKQGSAIPTAKELQQYLVERLPSYMVPSVFVQMQRIPLTPNGKVDFAALESPSSANMLAGKAARTSATPIEERLLVMARELLRREDVGLEDDFFLVGGHSLIGMQLVLRLREIFGVDFTLMQLFQAPTVEKMAAAIESLLIERIQAMSGEEVNMQVSMQGSD